LKGYGQLAIPVKLVAISSMAILANRRRTGIKRMSFLKHRLKICVSTDGQPLSWEEQLAAMASRKGKSLTKAEIRKLRHEHKQAERKYRKAMSKEREYVSPKVGSRLRNKNCTAIADATVHVRSKPTKLSKAQQRVLNRAAELEAKGHKVKISDGGLGLTHDGDWYG